MKVAVKNTASGLVPIYADDLDEKKKLKLDEVYWAEIKKARNLQFHKKFFALIKIGHANTKTFQEDIPLDAYRKWAIIKAGYCKMYKTPKGIFVDADSIAFENMDESKFQEVYNAVLEVIIKDIGANRETIERELLTFI